MASISAKAPIKPPARGYLIASARGFTLLELMAVVAIALILGSFIQLSFRNLLSKARDTRRMADVVTMQQAIATYVINNGAPPPDTGGPYGGWTVSYSTWFLSGLVPSYLSRSPRDPLNDITSSAFTFQNTDGHFYLYAYYVVPTGVNYYACPAGNFGVLGVKWLETGKKPTTPKAYCGPPPPFVCPGKVGGLCRDWSTEIDYSFMLHD